MLTFGSLFSGIGGFDRGFERAGMKCLWQVEFAEEPRRVLRRHWPGVELHEDVKNVGASNLVRVDVVCGGFPCQDLSVAGRREGLAGERSGLWFEFLRIVGELKPRWVVIENVPGLLSSWCPVEPPPDAVEGSEWEVEESSDFEVLLTGLADGGYGVAYRIFDAQYDGLAQRRERVFIVGSLGTGSSAQVLFESESVPWNPPARGEAGQAVARSVTASAGHHGHSSPRGDGSDNLVAGTMRSNGDAHSGFELDGGLIAAAFDPRNVTSKANRTRVEYGLPANTLHESGLSVITNCFNGYTGGPDDNDAQAHHIVPAFKRRGGFGWSESDNLSPTLESEGGTHQGGPERVPLVTAFDWQSGGDVRHNISEHHTSALQACQTPAIVYPIDTRNALRDPDKRDEMNRQGVGLGEDGDPCPTLTDIFTPAIAFRGNATTDVFEDQCGSVTTDSGSGNRLNVLHTGVRRLTPLECERLQGFPEVENTVIIEVCSDLQKNPASAESLNHKSPKSASSAGRNGSEASAPSAENPSRPSGQLTNKPAPSDALIFCGEGGAEIHSQGRLMWSASSAGRHSGSPLPIATEDFVQAVAGLSITAERITRDGRAASLPSGLCSIHQENGRPRVRLFGSEIKRLAKDVEESLTIGRKPTKSTTSDPSNTQSIVQTFLTSCCSVLNAITGFIPETIPNGSSFTIEVRTRFGWTRYGDDGKEISDSARYRMLGNAVAVPCAEWIGKRITIAASAPLSE